MEVKILGTTCPKCRQLQDVVLDAGDEAGVSLCIARVADEQAIRQYSIESTPGLVIGGELKSSGRVPSKRGDRRLATAGAGMTVEPSSASCRLRKRNRGTDWAR